MKHEAIIYEYGYGERGLGGYIRFANDGKIIFFQEDLDRDARKRKKALLEKLKNDSQR